MRKRLLVLGLLWAMAPMGAWGQTPEPVVHAVLFFSPTCGHCHQLIREHLVPMQEQYGRSLVILGMDTSQPWANNLYYETIRHFELPEEEWVVPMMVIGDEVLIGGITIPARLTRAMEEELPEGGIDLPDYPPLIDFLREQDALDSRYPDRLIVRQDPPEADPDEGVASTPAPEDPADPPVEVPSADTAASVGDSTNPGRGQEEAPTPAVPDPDSAGTPESVPPVESGLPTGTPESPAGEPESPTPEPEVAADAPGPGALEGPTGEEGPGETDPVGVGETDSAGAGAADTVGVGETDPVGATETPDLAAGLSLSESARSLESMGVWERFQLDPKGNSLSVLVLVGMIVSLLLRGFPPRVDARPWPGWVVPALVLVGASVAAYLSFIEVTQSEAVCGPVGDCNTVNQSRYATLFGVLPVGILGLVGYAVILVLWIARRTMAHDDGRVATIGLWLAALLGTLFSVYLTFLEPFVIGATCIWCLTSAVVMTLLLWASAPLAAAVWPRSATTKQGA